jgi:hypothetical protein
MIRFIAIAVLAFIVLLAPLFPAQSENRQPGSLSSGAGRITIDTRIRIIRARIDRLKTAVNQNVSRQEAVRLSAEISAKESLFQSYVDAYNAANQTPLAMGILSNHLTSLSPLLLDLEQRVFATTEKRKLEGDHVRSALERTDRVLDKASKFIRKSGTDEESFPGIRRAYELQDEARQKLMDKDITQAFLLTLKSREIVLKIAESALDSEDQNALIEKEKEFWEKTNLMIQKLEQEPARGAKEAGLLERAKVLQDKAASQLAEKQTLAAAQSSRAARRIVAGLAFSSKEEGDVRKALERVSAKQKQADAEASESKDTRAQKILEISADHLRQAGDLLSSDKDAAAAGHVRIAAKLIAKAMDMAADENGDSGSTGQLENELRRAQRILDRANRSALNDAERAKTVQAADLLKEADSSLRAKDIAKCRQLLDKATLLALEVLSR